MTDNTTFTPRKAVLVAVLGLLTIFAPLATDMYLAAIGHVATSMQASHSSAELSLSLFFLGLCVGQLFVGPLIDRVWTETAIVDRDRRLCGNLCRVDGHF